MSEVTKNYLSYYPATCEESKMTLNYYSLPHQSEMTKNYTNVLVLRSAWDSDASQGLLTSGKPDNNDNLRFLWSAWEQREQVRAIMQRDVRRNVYRELTSVDGPPRDSKRSTSLPLGTESAS